MIKNIKFFSLLMAEGYIWRCKEITNLAVISIVSPEMENPVKKLFGENERFLECVFYDVDLFKWPTAEEEGYKAFNEVIAKSIIEFVERMKDKVENLIIHCEAGVSRSSAVAKFISDCYYPYIRVKTY